MASRLNLQATLKSILNNENVYYDPPASIKMHYPAIRYSLNNIDSMAADNLPYSQQKSYKLILIDYNPDSEFVDKLSKLPMCSFGGHYVADNLHHYIFTLYY